jgi:acyl-CoA synthetase (NDP forming)
LDYLLDADGVRAVAVFLEGVSDGQRFRRCLQRARDLDVPVVLFKTGASPEGAAAVRSHSAVLAGRAEVYAAAIAQDGATEVEEMTALLEVAYVLAGPRAGGASIAVVTTSGGAGSATADLIVSAGLRLAGFARDTRTQLRATLPALATVANPLDVTAEGAFKPGAMEHTVGLVAADTAVDIVCVVLTSLAGEDAVRVAAEVGRAARTTGVPVLVTWLLDTSLTREGRSEFVAAGLRVFDEPARMVRAARALFELSSRRDTRSATNSD